MEAGCFVLDLVTSAVKGENSKMMNEVYDPT